MKHRHSCLLALALLCLAPLAALGADDAYTTGYVAAVLERQFNINPRSLKVKDGIVTIDAGDLPRADRPKIVSALSTIQGVTRVELLAAGQQAPTSPALAVRAAPAAAGAFACGRETVHAAARAILAGGNVRIFPLTFQQTHRFEPAECAVERPVRREKTMTALVAETFGDVVAVEFVSAFAAQTCGAEADGGFKREELTGLPSHVRTIGRYMPIVNGAYRGITPGLSERVSPSASVTRVAPATSDSRNTGFSNARLRSKSSGGSIAAT